MAEFKPKTVYVIYIAATPEKIWQALTDRELSKQYFHGNSIEIEPRAGGSFLARWPDGRVNVSGKVIDWSPPRRLATTWTVEWVLEMRELPECLVSYDIEPAGDCVRLILTESYSWDVPEAILAGGRSGWPAILSSLKSVLETGKALNVEMAPPQDMLDAMNRVLAEKPWRKKPGEK
jgi:uncharacterized protein YndB with AHSA1/START domain